MTTATVTEIALSREPDRATYRFSDLIRSEFTKLRSVRSTAWTLGLTAVLGIGLSILATVETRAHWATMSLGDRLTFDPTRLSLIGIFFAQLTIGVLGVLALSSEYGTGTIRASLAATPRRPLVLAAKASVFAVVALVVTEISAFAAYFVGQTLLTAPATHTTLSSPGALRAVAGSGLYITVLGLFALGLAAIIRHTAGAISTFVGILLVLPLVAESLPETLGTDISRFLPAHIGQGMVSLHTQPKSFAPWPGLLLMCGYAAVARLGERGRIATLREAGRVLAPQEAGLAAYLVALLNWHRRHRFCPGCGASLRVSDAGFSRTCPGCSTQHFPRTDPAVIVLVEHDGHALLGRQAGWPPGQYSVLAGFVGPGESLEEAVIREVKEESGITVHDPQFVESQPWPFPLSVMLGFEARADGGTPAPRDGELEDVRWFTREQVGEGLAGRSSELVLPPGISISYFLVERWFRRGKFADQFSSPQTPQQPRR